MDSFKFSGHETFACRHYWLKKGYDFVAHQKKFTADNAVVDLGVGKNMVISIHYWLRAFDIIDDKDDLTDLAQCLFSDDGWDPFLEDEATLWLLHYKLQKKRYASIYYIIFSELRKQFDIFCLTFAGLISLSARLLVNGTSLLKANASTASCSLIKRSTRFLPLLL